MGRLKKAPDPREAEFQEVMKSWNQFHDLESYHEIWNYVYEACKAASKKSLKVYGISLDDITFNDRLMKSVDKVVRYIVDNGHWPRKLITFVWLPTYAEFFGPTARKEDNELSYEMQVENGYDVVTDICGKCLYEVNGTTEEVRGICREELMTTYD